jgi:prophage regulatory protein
MSNTIIRLPMVKRKSGKSRSGIYKDMANNLFPQSVPLGDRAVGWVEAEVDEWIQQRIDLRDELKK